MRGTTLGDRYRLDEWLGGGSMGDVWLARDQVLDRRVAVKILKPALLDEPGFAERFHDEARVMARLRHPGIVGVYDFGPGRTVGDVPSWGAPPPLAARPVAYLVMELIVGEPLSTVMERRGPLTVPETLGLALEVLAALEAAHEAGIVHRDIKPANLMVRDGHVVITDFGIARPGCDARLTVPGMVLGTAAYQAPEQASTGTVTSSADLYALGVVLYECLTGRLPFEGESALELILKHLTDPVPPLPADVPVPVRALVERAMAKDPALRWPGAAAMAAAVRAALAGEPVEGPPLGTPGGAATPGGTAAGLVAGGRAAGAAVRSTGAMAALRSTGTATLGPVVTGPAGPLGSGARLLGTGAGPLGSGAHPLGSGAYPLFGTGVGPLGSGAHPFGTAAREGLAPAAPPRRAARWRAALFGTRRRTLLVATAAVLCCAATATGAVMMHRTTATAGTVAAESAAASAPSGVPLSAAVAPAPDAGTPSPSPSAPAPSTTLLPGAPGAPLPDPGSGGVGGVGGVGGPAAGTAGGPVGRDGASNVPGNPGAPAAGSAAGAGAGAPVDPAGSAAPGGPGAPGSPAGNQPERPSTANPVYTAAPPPTDPVYTANPRRTVPPAYSTSTLPPAPVYTPPPAYTPPPNYTASPPPKPPVTFPTDPPIKPPTQQPGPLPARARMSIAGSVLSSQSSLDRDGNPVVTAPDDGGPGGVWQLTKRAEGGYFLFNGATQYSKALDLEETRSQTRLWHAPPPGANQIWSFTPVAGGYLLALQGDWTRCLSAAGPNVPATVRPCESSADQVWTVSAA